MYAALALALGCAPGPEEAWHPESGQGVQGEDTAVVDGGGALYAAGPWTGEGPPTLPRPPRAVEPGLILEPTIHAAPPSFHYEGYYRGRVWGDVDLDGADDLFLIARGMEAGGEQFYTYFVSGAGLGRGSRSVAEVLSSAPVGCPGGDDRFVYPAGDVNGDGREDVWISSRLYLAPFEGGRVCDRDEQAVILHHYGEQSYGNFDADGDGHFDVLFVSDEQTAVVYYGPFAGELSNMGSEALPSTQFDAYCDTANSATTLLPGLYGPGTLGISVGLDFGGLCTSQHLWEVPKDRREFLSFGLRQAYNSGGSSNPSQVYGDWNGDGYLDITANSRIVLGPFVDDVNLLHVSRAWDHPSTSFMLIGLMPDATGDGFPEQVVLDAEGYYWVVPGQIDPTSLASRKRHGARLAGAKVDRTFNDRTPFGGLAGDFDGDGKGDLLGFDYGTSPASLVVWYGADLFPD